MIETIILIICIWIVIFLFYNVIYLNIVLFLNRIFKFTTYSKITDRYKIITNELGNVILLDTKFNTQTYVQDILGNPIMFYKK